MLIYFFKDGLFGQGSVVRALLLYRDQGSWVQSSPGPCFLDSNIAVCQLQGHKLQEFWKNSKVGCEWCGALPMCP